MGASSIRTRYLSEAARVLAPLPADERADLLREIESHLIDSANATPSTEDDDARMRAAVARLGEPREYLRPIVADHLLAHGTSTYRPWAIARGLYANLFTGVRTGLTSAAFGLGYLLIGIFTVMAVIKAFVPDHVGYFVYPDGSRAFGMLAHTDAAHEMLGWWVVPASLVAATLLYVGMTRWLAAHVRRGRRRS